MKTFECQTPADLQHVFDGQAPGALFRGQHREYLRPDGGPDIRTTFDRLGCVPPRMLKWWHYSRVILATYAKAFDGATDYATDQAILQHYGWRSFFLDATSEPSVACWFAGNVYHSKPCGELIEDCFEDPLFVTREHAWYEPADELGCVYVLDRKALRARNLQAVDLVEITMAAGRHRCVEQSAFMVGLLHGQLPSDCLAARIVAPSAAFRAIADRSGHTCQRLFPSPNTDPVLATLLSLPWVRRAKSAIDFYDRGLPLPEYEVGMIRRTGAGTAYYRRFWLADRFLADPEYAPATFYLTEEAFFHGTAETGLHFPRLTQLLQEQTRAVVEIDGLVSHPNARGSSQYGKGIFVEAQDDGTILLTELVVEHLGNQVRDFGITRGSYFRADAQAHWHRVDHPEQCDCGNDSHHAHHLVVAGHFERELAEGTFRPVRERVYATANVDPLSDPDAWKGLE